MDEAYAWIVYGLAAALIYALIFAVMLQRGFGLEYGLINGVVISIKTLGITFLVWMFLGPPRAVAFLVYFTIIFAVMAGRRWSSLSKVEEAAEVTFQKLFSLIDDFAHFAREYDRGMTIVLDGKRIVADLYVHHGDELRSRCQSAINLQNQNVNAICFGKYIPENGDTLIYMACGGGTIESRDLLRYKSSFGTATGEEFRVITRKIKSRYSNFQENMQGVFHIRFYRDQ